LRTENVFYTSTRGKGKTISSSEAIVRGIADDGGLFVPDNIPYIEDGLEELASMTYKELAFKIMDMFFTDFKDIDLKDCINKAYDSKFDTPEIAPVVKKGDRHYLELFHGATLAFKDMALSILPHLLKYAVKNISIDKKIVILTATSGDTGKAALESFADVENTLIIVFYPKEGVSKIQERQMITQQGGNTSVIAIKGNFDDAQNGVKKIFADQGLKDDMSRNGFMFSSANSINIGRLIPQIVYYIYAYTRLLRSKSLNRPEPVDIVVPTGNFGNILAAYYSYKMGLPVSRLICASNENNVLYDFLNTGQYDRRRDLILTSSPSMDILVSSNLERLLYDISGQDPERINDLMERLRSKGVFSIGTGMRQGLDKFYGQFATEKEVFSTIKKTFDMHDYLIDTHTAVGSCVYDKYISGSGDRREVIIASTASPFKFPRAVLGSISQRLEKEDDFKLIKILSETTGYKVPAQLADLDTRPVLHDRVCEKDGMLDEVKDILGI